MLARIHYKMTARGRPIPVDEVCLFPYKPECPGTISYVCTHTETQTSFCSTCESRSVLLAKKSRRTYLSREQFHTKKPVFAGVPVSDDCCWGTVDEGEVRKLVETERYWRRGTLKEYRGRVEA